MKNESCPFENTICESKGLSMYFTEKLCQSDFLIFLIHKVFFMVRNFTGTKKKYWLIWSVIFFYMKSTNQ